MFEGITNFFKRIGKKEQLEASSKDTAKERLHLVLMQDRANVSADFLDMMRKEIIEVIKKYIDVDENDIDVRLTNRTNDDGTTGAPALYANIPIAGIKEDVKNKKPEEQKIDEKKVEKEGDNKKADKALETNKTEEKTEPEKSVDSDNKASETDNDKTKKNNKKSSTGNNSKKKSANSNKKESKKVESAKQQNSNVNSEDIAKASNTTEKLKIKVENEVK